MVSNVLGLTAEELLAQLRALRDSHGADPEYQELRTDLPAEWPI
ncbi:MAG TPA: hypothetical protein VK009_03760 [Chloroflexota bacterium]|nr:hypothetical protein [Chloroflexota bacterium]